MVNDEDPVKGSWTTETARLQNDVSNPHPQLPTPTHNQRTQYSSKSHLNISKSSRSADFWQGGVPACFPVEGGGQKGSVLSPPLGSRYTVLFQHERAPQPRARPGKTLSHVASTTGLPRRGHTEQITPMLRGRYFLQRSPCVHRCYAVSHAVQQRKAVMSERRDHNAVRPNFSTHFY